MKDVERHLNNTINGTTGKTPFKCLFGYTPKFEDAKLAYALSKESYQKPEDIREEARNRMITIQEKYKKHYDKKKYFENYEVGDIVVMKRVTENTGEPTKTQPKYRGPLVIIKKIGKDIYKVESLDKADRSRVFCTNAHVSHLKRYQNSIEDDNSGEDDSEGEERHKGDIEEDKQYKVIDEYDSDDDYTTDLDYIPEKEIQTGLQNEDRRPSRNRRPPARFKDYIVDFSG